MEGLQTPGDGQSHNVEIIGRLSTTPAQRGSSSDMNCPDAFRLSDEGRIAIIATLARTRFTDSGDEIMDLQVDLLVLAEAALSILFNARKAGKEPPVPLNAPGMGEELRGAIEAMREDRGLPQVELT